MTLNKWHSHCYATIKRSQTRYRMRNKISPEKYHIVHLLVCLSSISYFGNRMKLSFRNRLFSIFNPCGWDWPQSPPSKMGTGTRPSPQSPHCDPEMGSESNCLRSKLSFSSGLTLDKLFHTLNSFHICRMMMTVTPLLTELWWGWKQLISGKCLSQYQAW